MADNLEHPDHGKDTPYFAYYAALVNQANMLMDSARTGVYQQSILGNSQTAFLGKDVLDVGAGSGILSFFSAQAGAKTVYACEASDIASKLQLIVDEADNGGKNAFLKDKIKVVKCLFWVVKNLHTLIHPQLR